MESPLASLFWRHLRVYQVYGANSDVGKTVFATLLGRTAKKLWRDEAVSYLKPVSTGPAHEADHWCKSLVLAGFGDAALCPTPFLCLEL